MRRIALIKLIYDKKFKKIALKILRTIFVHKKNVANKNKTSKNEKNISDNVS